jgi:hypothetical protein
VCRHIVPARSAQREVENLVDLKLTTDANAPAAEDESVQIPLDHEIGFFYPASLRVDLEAGLLDCHLVDDVPQLPVPVLFTLGAVVDSQAARTLHYFCPLFKEFAPLAVLMESRDIGVEHSCEKYLDFKESMV